MPVPTLSHTSSAKNTPWLVLLSLAGPLAAQTTLYDFGNPGPEEQLYLELINRARANPAAEGARLAATTDPDVLAAYDYEPYWTVDLAMMQSEFNALAAAPPLAPHAGLMAAARGHSQWMLDNATQAHNQTNPSNTPWDRITDAGYDYSTAGENVYAFAKSVWHGHAGFQVDWGSGGTGGMQAGRGHRMSIHNANFREIGVGVTLGTNGNVGPQQVTQDFGARFDSPNLGTGVAYYDLNGNDFYDQGEGISGLTVNVSGASYHCLTAAGGGWVVPCPTSAANRTVTFSGLNVSETAAIVFPASKNAKADLKLTYQPPSITSTASATAGAPHALAFTAVGGATSYKWTRSMLSAAAAENCENTLNVTPAIAGTYSLTNTNVKAQGAASFHLANANATNQSFTLNALYHGGSSPALSFQSRLRTSTTSEAFKVQVKEEGSAVWQDAYSQLGYNGSGEAGFSLREVALAGMAGKSFRVRFILQFSSGSWYGGATADDHGWFIDAINFSGVSSLSDTVAETLATTSGSFTPAEGSYLMSVAPVISGREFPATYQTLAAAAEPPPSFATWAAETEAAHSLAAGTLADAMGDYDGDGRCHLVEYAFGGSPVLANDPTPGMPAMEMTATHFVLRYHRDTSRGDVTLTPEASSSLGVWTAPGDPGAPAGFTDDLVATDGSIETREAKIPRSSGASLFMRVRVSRP